MESDLPFAQDDFEESDFQPALTSAVQRTLVNSIPLDGSGFIAPFVPVSEEVAEAALNTSILDQMILSCGDGRILERALAFPVPPSRCIGVELDPFLAEHIRTDICPKYPGDILQIIEKDMFDVDLESIKATALCLYLLPKGLERLRENHCDSLPKSSPQRRVVTITYSIPELECTYSRDLITVSPTSTTSLNSN
ncbi:hypothetical protein BC829DRAFT_404371 [Chytridium lagenaria]|nr:hypothetical protein BC829DRAFT_404371 [Chytridium lagenaria]